MAYTPSNDFDASPCGYEAPLRLATDFDRACLPGSTRLNMCGPVGATTLNLGCYVPQLLLELSVAFSVVYNFLVATPRAEQGEVSFSFDSAMFSAGAATADAQTLLNLTANLLSNRFLRAVSSVSLAATLSETFGNVRTTFAALTTLLSVAQSNAATASMQSSVDIDLSAAQTAQARASVLGDVPLALVLSYFYASLASCFPETAFQSILSAINAHFVHGYADVRTDATLGSRYAKSVHYTSDYIESIISYIDVLGAKFDLGIVSNDGRIVRLQVKDNIVKISFNDRLSDVNGLFEKTLIIQPSTRIIDVIASEKLGSTG